jgi:excisionase family DNA binding protein
MTTTENHPFTVHASDRLMTVEDLCAYLGVSKDFIYDQVRDGRLLAIRIARQLRFRIPDVDAFIDANVSAGRDLWPPSPATAVRRSIRSAVRGGSA